MMRPTAQTAATKQRAAAKGSKAQARMTGSKQAFGSHQQRNAKLEGGNNPLPFIFIAVLVVLLILSAGIFGLNTVLYFTSPAASVLSSVPVLPQSSLRSKVAAIPLDVHASTRSPPFQLAIPRQQAMDLLQQLRAQFAERYGGKAASDGLLKQGLRAYGDIDATARRFLLAKYERRSFDMAFSGYSITVGRGNFFHQSYPFVMQRALKDAVQAILSIDLKVTNGAIGGIPSFPYGFCLEHFLGTSPEVISWDYSMNENSRDTSVLEAWIRQATQQMTNQPMIIMLDSNAGRNKLLKQYADQGMLQDAVSISKASEIVDKAKIEKAVDLPVGFQNWDEFGAPKRCPGRGSWHPKKMEHELMGWLLVMHFVDVLERAVELMTSSEDDAATGSAGHPELEHELEQMIIQREHHRQGHAPAADSELSEATESHMLQYPAPLSQSLPDNDESVTELLYGHSQINEIFQMKDVSCRTSFLPATDHDKVLPSIVVSGMAEQGEMDIMIDRTDEMYQNGWVLDISKLERDTKRKVEACGGLGYIDMKIALYGIAESGPLELWLPFEKSQQAHEDHDDHDDNTLASHFFDSIVFCEANEKREDGACKLDHDLQITIDGIEVPIDTIQPIKGAGVFLKRATCVSIPIPDEAKITNRDTQGIGLPVTVTPAPTVERATGACCLSHIVWEQH